MRLVFFAAALTVSFLTHAAEVKEQDVKAENVDDLQKLVENQKKFKILLERFDKNQTRENFTELYGHLVDIHEYNGSTTNKLLEDTGLEKSFILPPKDFNDNEGQALAILSHILFHRHQLPASTLVKINLTSTEYCFGELDNNFDRYACFHALYENGPDGAKLSDDMATQNATNIYASVINVLKHMKLSPVLYKSLGADWHVNDNCCWLTLTGLGDPIN